MKSVGLFIVVAQCLVSAPARASLFGEDYRAHYESCVRSLTQAGVTSASVLDLAPNYAKRLRLRSTFVVLVAHNTVNSWHRLVFYPLNVNPLDRRTFRAVASFENTRLDILSDPDFENFNRLSQPVGTVDARLFDEWPVVETSLDVKDADAGLVIRDGDAHYVILSPSIMPDDSRGWSSLRLASAVEFDGRPEPGAVSNVRRLVTFAPRIFKSDVIRGVTTLVPTAVGHGVVRVCETIGAGDTRINACFEGWTSSHLPVREPRAVVHLSHAAPRLSPRPRSRHQE